MQKKKQVFAGFGRTVYIYTISTVFIKAFSVTATCIFLVTNVYDGCEEVLVQIGDHNRVVQFSREASSGTERECLLAAIKTAYEDKIGEGDKITLQLKNEDWGGFFVDFFRDDVEHKSVLRMLIEKAQEVCICSR